MTPELNQHIALTLAAIRLMRAAGLIGENEPISIKRMAAISEEIGAPVSARTLGRIERRAMAKIKQNPIALIALKALSR